MDEAARQLMKAIISRHRKDTECLREVLGDADAFDHGFIKGVEAISYIRGIAAAIRGAQELAAPEA